MSNLKDYFFTENHEWIHFQEEETKIGITRYAVEELGDIVFVELPDPGEEINQFEQFGVIESVKAVSDVYAPAGGKIIEINQKVIEQPELVNESPYDNGWLVKIKVNNEKEKENLMNNNEYSEFIEEE